LPSDLPIRGFAHTDRAGGEPAVHEHHDLQLLVPGQLEPAARLHVPADRKITPEYTLPGGEHRFRLESVIEQLRALRKRAD
jgi:hypothetical protein